MAPQTRDRFEAVLRSMGSDVVYHREEGGIPCPCRTAEGFRDPVWHREHPEEPVCNEQGFLTTATVVSLKASVQPAFGGISRHSQRANDLLGDIQRDDKIGLFPVEWNGNVISFEDWSEAGEDFIIYDGKRFVAVSADKVPDVDGLPHHWEVGLRLVKYDRPDQA